MAYKFILIVVKQKNLSIFVKRNISPSPRPSFLNAPNFTQAMELSEQMKMKDYWTNLWSC